MYFLEGCPIPSKIVDVVKNFYNVLLIAVPILLLVLGTVDLAKAVMGGDEKEIKGATSLLTKRAGAAVGVFLLGSIISFILSLVPDSAGFLSCWDFSSGGSNNNNNTVKCPSNFPQHNGVCYNPGDRVSVCASGYTYKPGTLPMCDPNDDEKDTIMVQDSMCGTSRVRIEEYCYLIVKSE